MYYAGEGGYITSDDPQTTPEQPRPLVVGTHASVESVLTFVLREKVANPRV